MSDVKIVIFEDGKEVETFLPIRRSATNGTAFSSGKSGWHAQGKAVIDGKRVQCNLLFVEIVPKEQKPQVSV